MKHRIRLILAIIIFGAASSQAQLALPPGAKSPNITPASFANAVTLGFHFGPGVWIDPHIASLSAKVADSQLGSTCILDSKLAISDALLSPYVPAMVGLYTPQSCNPLPSDTHTILFGLNGAGDSASNAYAYVQDLESVFLNLVNADHMKIAVGSSGAMLLNEIGTYEALGYFTSNRDETARQIYLRHNLHVASYRAIGLNPMWSGADPTLIPSVDAGVADYYVNVYSRFFYNEGQKIHSSTPSQPDFLGLLYKVFAANLSYGAGLMEYRYAPIDPSCRYPINAANLCPISPGDLTALFNEWSKGPAPLIANQPIVNFGTAGDFVTIYDLIKFVAGATGGDPYKIATDLANGNTTSFVTSATTAIGGSYPNSIPSAIATAKIIFDNAYGMWSKESSVAKESAVFMPRVSSALIVATALIGKRIDPIFWGVLAEAEQYEMKTNPGGYLSWADKLLGSSNTSLVEQLRFAVWDYAAFRSGSALQWNPTSLGRLMKSAEDSASQTFALARGPNGLDSIDGERFETASEYDLNHQLSPMPYPNAFLEAAESGHGVIDGRLYISTDGKAQAYDVDNSLTSTELPFEIDVLKTYQKIAALQVLGVSLSQEAPTISAMAAQTRNLIGAPLPSGVSNAESDYRNSVGESKPLNSNASDSRYFQPSLEYWLVIADKLNSTGLDTLANYDPPELQSVAFNAIPVMTDPTSHITYGLMNIANQIAKSDIKTSQDKPYFPPTGSAGPTSDAIPLDSDQQVDPPPKFINEVLELQNQVLTKPFLSDDNPFL